MVQHFVMDIGRKEYMRTFAGLDQKDKGKYLYRPETQLVWSLG